MPKRPYVNLSIVDLEDLTENHWQEDRFLGQLKYELVKRKSKRAKKLLERIRGRLSDGIEELRRQDRFCEECGDVMEVKHGKHGMFWGCSGYPDCSYTVKVTKDDWQQKSGTRTQRSTA